MVGPAVVSLTAAARDVGGQRRAELRGLIASCDGAVDAGYGEATDDGQEPGTEIPEFHPAAAEEKVADPSAYNGSDDAEHEAGHPAAANPAGHNGLNDCTYYESENDPAKKAHVSSYIFVGI